MESLKIIYPYNEILPKKAAHDVYVFHNCLSLASNGFSVNLLCGKGSLSDVDLKKHFFVTNLEQLSINRLPIIRKNNLLNITWNPFFFHFCQKFIEKEQPYAVISSVLKQARHHFSQKLPKTKYIYEVHQLGNYPNGEPNLKEFELEKKVFAQSDLIVTTTQALKDILRKPPYSVNAPIEVIPLAVHAIDIPQSSCFPLKLAYVGQLYDGQGINLLLRALIQATNLTVDIIGGKKEEILNLQKMAIQLGVQKKVNFLGFHPPHAIPNLVKNCHAFIAPFENQGRMPYVAHTKLLEYAHWNRPIIAPDLPVVRELFTKGAMLFKADDEISLSQCIEKLKDPICFQRLQKEISQFKNVFSWEARAKNYSQLLTSL